MPNFTFTRDIPNGPNNPSADQPIMQTNANSTDSILDVDLYGFNDNNGGYHQKSTYVVQGVDPTPLNTDGSQCITYSKDAAGVAELFVTRFGNSTPIQLTKGAVSATGNATSVGQNGYTFLPGGIIMQWGTINSSFAGTPFTFPIVFTNLFSLTITPGSRQVIYYTSASTSGATLVRDTGSSSICTYIAIGN